MAGHVSPRPVAASRVEMVQLVMPNDLNPLGTIFGGLVMEYVDIAATLAAHRHARRTVVTASVDAMVFRKPIHSGSAIVLKAWLNWAGRSSMEAQVEVYAEDLDSGFRDHTSTAFVTVVGVDDHGRPAAIPALELLTEEEHQRFRAAEKRREQRLRKREGDDA